MFNEANIIWEVRPWGDSAVLVNLWGCYICPETGWTMKQHCLMQRRDLDTEEEYARAHLRAKMHNRFLKDEAKGKIKPLPVTVPDEYAELDQSDDPHDDRIQSNPWLSGL